MMLDRRGFISSLAAVGSAGVAGSTQLAGAAAAFGLPASATEEFLQQTPAPLPGSALYSSNEEAYWTELRKQFLIPEDEVYLNNGTVGSSPMPVLRAIFDAYRDTEKMAQSDPEDYPIWGYAAWNEFRDPLAEFVGCKRDEIALVRNATEANSYIANGLDMKPGDEVLMTDQEHPGGEHPWNLRAKRYGIVVKKVALPKPVANAADVLNRFSAAITPRTRVIFFSHITTATGVVLPARELCELARSKGIISAVDGAHVTGMMKLNVHEIGCDFYSSSPHKWLQATKGSGFLYVRDEMIDRLWNTIVTEGWDEPQLRAERFQRIGSSNVPALHGLRAAIELANKIGMERIEKRHRQMADHILKEMMARGAESWTSPDAALRCGIVTVNVPPTVRVDLEKWLWKEKKIRIRGGEPSKLRLSTPYYVLAKDVARYLAAFDEYRHDKKLS
ncbi:MAG TPA: aminotransferase class V-fold PLP-dependent enzyme [Candidatus Acidoferrum sp.]|jgi:selenocysteine lyase/cysteine desulfurase